MEQTDREELKMIYSFETDLKELASVQSLFSLNGKDYGGDKRMKHLNFGRYRAYGISEDLWRDMSAESIFCVVYDGHNGVSWLNGFKMRADDVLSCVMERFPECLQPWSGAFVKSVGYMHTVTEHVKSKVIASIPITEEDIDECFALNEEMGYENAIVLTSLSIRDMDFDDTLDVFRGYLSSFGGNNILMVSSDMISNNKEYIIGNPSSYLQTGCIMYTE